MTEPDLLDVLGTAATDFVAAAAEVDPAAAVPSCPGWTVLDLERHLGTTWRWAADNATAAGESVARGNDSDAPATGPAVLAWLADGAASLGSRLGGLPAQTPCWAFGPRPHTVAIWRRRMTYETLVHLADLQLAAGRDPLAASTIADHVALDGIEEALTVFLPGRRRRGNVREAGCIELVSGDRRFLVATAGDDEPVTAVVVGPPLALLLALWGRLRLDDPRLHVEGDRATAVAVLGAGLVP